VNYLRTKYPTETSGGFQVIFVANEGARSVVQGARFNRMGRVKGHSDLYMFWEMHGIMFIGWLEMKKPDGEVRSEQDDFLNSIPITNNSFKGIAYSFNEGKEIVDGWISRSKVVSQF